MDAAHLCKVCQTLDLEFFLSEERADQRVPPGPDDDKDSFTMITAVPHHSSILELHVSARSGCNLCYMILSRIHDLPDFKQPGHEVDSRIQLGMMFQQYHRLVIHYRGASLMMPVYSIALNTDDEYSAPPSRIYPLDSSPTIELAKSWLHDCDLIHRRCYTKNSGISAVPSRLIDLGTLEYSHLRLIFRKDYFQSQLQSLPEHPRVNDGRYMTLSHCWGAPSDFQQRACTTKNNIEARKSNIDIAILPKTFQDAIKITRYLGVRFLWIDTLCIVQDDAQDIDQEYTAMKDIFLGSYCTIAASDSHDGNGGCFVPIKIPSVTCCSFECHSSDRSKSAEISVYQGFDEWSTSIIGPLQRRGWTLQERYLTSRVLHFTKSRLLFECQEWNASADRPMLSPKTNDGNLGVLGLLRASGHRFSTLDIPLIRKTWIELVEEYSRRALTFPTDKLPALSGLLGWFVYEDDVYAAGLWKSSFGPDLYWRPDIHTCYAENQQSFESISLLDTSSAGHHRTRIPGLPTWSWASLSSAVIYRGYSTSTEAESFKLIDLDIKLAGINPYGAVGHAKAKVSGFITTAYAVKLHDFRGSDRWYETIAPLKSIDYSTVDAISRLPASNVLVGDIFAANTFRAIFSVDVTDETISPDMELTCLITCHIKLNFTVDEPDIVGLVLQQTDQGEWRRVGTFQTRKDEMKWFRQSDELVLV